MLQELLQLNIRKINNWGFLMGKNSEQIIYKRNTLEANKHVRDADVIMRDVNLQPQQATNKSDP